MLAVKLDSARLFWPVSVERGLARDAESPPNLGPARSTVEGGPHCVLERVAGCFEGDDGPRENVKTAGLVVGGHRTLLSDRRSPEDRTERTIKR